jgi:hypothetical protein
VSVECHGCPTTDLSTSRKDAHSGWQRRYAGGVGGRQFHLASAVPPALLGRQQSRQGTPGCRAVAGVQAGWASPSRWNFALPMAEKRPQGFDVNPCGRSSCTRMGSNHQPSVPQVPQGFLSRFSMLGENPGFSGVFAFTTPSTLRCQSGETRISGGIKLGDFEGELPSPNDRDTRRRGNPVLVPPQPTKKVRRPLPVFLRSVPHSLVPCSRLPRTPGSGDGIFEAWLTSMLREGPAAD